MIKAMSQIGNERGFTMVTVGGGLVMFLSFFALVVDLGNPGITRDSSAYQGICDG